MYLNFYKNNDWGGLDIRVGPKLNIKEHIRCFLEDESTNNPVEIKNAAKLQIPRPFKAKSEGVKYHLGHILPCERGPSDLDWYTIEFKELTGVDLANYEEPFIIRLIKFACGCLNRRCNGTIYFGVADEVKKKYKHGEVVGINATISDVNRFQCWLERHVTGSSPIRFNRTKKLPGSNEMIKAFGKCVGPVRAIEIEGSSKIILEIDVEPLAEVCKAISFYFTNFKDKNETCLREGTETKSSEDVNKWKSEIEKFADLRNGHEWKEATGGENQSEKLHKLICRNRMEIDYSDFSYHLIANHPDNTDDVTWTTRINWSLIFDFDENTREGGGFLNFVQNKEDYFRYSFHCYLVIWCAQFRSLYF